MCYTNLEDGNSPHFNVIVANQHHFDLQILMRDPYLLKFLHCSFNVTNCI